VSLDFYQMQHLRFEEWGQHGWSYQKIISCEKIAYVSIDFAAVDNRPGASSVIGSDFVAKSPADGYTLLMMSNTHTTNESLNPKKPFVLCAISCRSRR
jgi:hypothetical protein